MLQHGLLHHRLMAGQAIHRRVAAQQVEGRLAVIEARAILPGRHRVAGLAAGCRGQLSVGTAVAIGAVRRRRVIRRIPAARLVAAGARYGNMRCLQGKARPVMSGQGVNRRRPAGLAVAILAAVLVGRTRELAFVGVLVACGAGGEGHAIRGLFTLWQMALCARHTGMLSEQRVGGPGVVRDGETGRLPSGFAVAGLAVAAVFAMRELAAMLVRVAIQAARERDVGFEILGLVTVLANYARMLAGQGVVGFAMVETIGWKDLLPTTCDMAMRAIAVEGIAMRVLMARGTEVEQRKALVLDGASRGRSNRPMASGAIHFGV